jgi:hypothetical protein
MRETLCVSPARSDAARPYQERYEMGSSRTTQIKKRIHSKWSCELSSSHQNAVDEVPILPEQELIRHRYELRVLQSLQYLFEGKGAVSI